MASSLEISKISLFLILILIILAEASIDSVSKIESFKKLESGENSDEHEVVNECCIREHKFLTLGQDLNGDEIRFDVGSCRKHCSNRITEAKPLKREEFDKYLKKYPKMDPIQIFLTLQNRQTSDETSSLLEHASTSDLSRSSCRFASCEATSTRRQRHFSITGHYQDLEVIESCDCIVPQDSCTRISKNIRFHDSTPYETTVDIGQCSGPCNDPEHSSCRAIRNKTINIEGPNGFECVSVVEECQCVGSCYRTRQFHKVYDYSLLFDRANITDNNGNNTLDAIGETNFEFESNSEPLVKVVDLGQCQGTCQALLGSSKCLIRSANNETCVSSLYGGHNHCVPSRLVSHFYTDRKGQRHSLVSVTSCGCR